MKFIKNEPKTDEIKKMVLIIGDSGESYLTHAFDDNWMKEKGFIDESIIKELRDFYI